MSRFSLTLVKLLNFVMPQYFLSKIGILPQRIVRKMCVKYFHNACHVANSQRIAAVIQCLVYIQQGAKHLTYLVTFNPKNDLAMQALSFSSQPQE